jgi:hypothetical protein
MASPQAQSEDIFSPNWAPQSQQNEKSASSSSLSAAEANPDDIFTPRPVKQQAAAQPRKDESSWVTSANEAIASNPNDPTALRVAKSLGRLAMMPVNVEQAVVNSPTEEDKREGFTGPVGRMALPAHRLAVAPSEAAERDVEETALRTAARGGKPSKVAIYGGAALASVPILGPMALQEGKQAQAGDVAGTATDVAGMLLAPEAAERIPYVGPTMRAVGRTLSRDLTPTIELPTEGFRGVEATGNSPFERVAADKPGPINVKRPGEIAPEHIGRTESAPTMRSPEGTVQGAGFTARGPVRQLPAAPTGAELGEVPVRPAPQMRPTPAVLGKVPGPRMRGVAIPPEVARDITNITQSEALGGVRLNAPEPEGAALGRLRIPEQPIEEPATDTAAQRAAETPEQKMNEEQKPVPTEQSAGLTEKGQLNEAAKRGLEKIIGKNAATHLGKNPQANDALIVAMKKATNQQLADWANAKGYFKIGDPEADWTPEDFKRGKDSGNELEQPKGTTVNKAHVNSQIISHGHGDEFVQHVNGAAKEVP